MGTGLEDNNGTDWYGYRKQMQYVIRRWSTSSTR